MQGTSGAGSSGPDGIQPSSGKTVAEPQGSSQGRAVKYAEAVNLLPEVRDEYFPRGQMKCLYRYRTARLPATGCPDEQPLAMNKTDQKYLEDLKKAVRKDSAVKKILTGKHVLYNWLVIQARKIEQYIDSRDANTSSMALHWVSCLDQACQGGGFDWRDLPLALNYEFKPPVPQKVLTKFFPDDQEEKKLQVDQGIGFLPPWSEKKLEGYSPAEVFFRYWEIRQRLGGVESGLRMTLQDFISQFPNVQSWLRKLDEKVDFQSPGFTRLEVEVIKDWLDDCDTSPNDLLKKKPWTWREAAYADPDKSHKVSRAIQKHADANDLVDLLPPEGELEEFTGSEPSCDSSETTEKLPGINVEDPLTAESFPAVMNVSDLGSRRKRPVSYSQFFLPSESGSSKSGSSHSSKESYPGEEEEFVASKRRRRKRKSDQDRGQASLGKRGPRQKIPKQEEQEVEANEPVKYSQPDDDDSRESDVSVPVSTVSSEMVSRPGPSQPAKRGKTRKSQKGRRGSVAGSRSGKSSVSRGRRSGTRSPRKLKSGVFAEMRVPGRGPTLPRTRYLGVKGQEKEFGFEYFTEGELSDWMQKKHKKPVRKEKAIVYTPGEAFLMGPRAIEWLLFRLGEIVVNYSDEGITYDPEEVREELRQIKSAADELTACVLSIDQKRSGEGAGETLKSGQISTEAIAALDELGRLKGAVRRFFGALSSDLHGKEWRELDKNLKMPLGYLTRFITESGPQMTAAEVLPEMSRQDADKLVIPAALLKRFQIDVEQSFSESVREGKVLASLSEVMKVVPGCLEKLSSKYGDNMKVWSTEPAHADFERVGWLLDQFSRPLKARYLKDQRLRDRAEKALFLVMNNPGSPEQMENALALLPEEIRSAEAMRKVAARLSESIQSLGSVLLADEEAELERRKAVDNALSDLSNEHFNNHVAKAMECLYNLKGLLNKTQQSLKTEEHTKAVGVYDNAWPSMTDELMELFDAIDQ